MIEGVYLLGWTTTASDTSPFAEFVEHWTTPEFAAFVDALGALATPEGHSKLTAEVLSLEVAIWDMALE